MLETIEGIFRDGRVELLETPPYQVETRVFVTFLPSSTSPSAVSPLLTPPEAADLRVRLQSFAEDWNHPGMDVYDEL